MKPSNAEEREVWRGIFVAVFAQQAFEEITWAETGDLAVQAAEEGLEVFRFQMKAYDAS